MRDASIIAVTPLRDGNLWVEPQAPYPWLEPLEFGHAVHGAEEARHEARDAA